MNLDSHLLDVVVCPACRVRRSCMPDAPADDCAITCSICATTSVDGAASIKPPTDSRITAVPVRMILSATSAATSGSSNPQPVTSASSRPTTTPTEV